MAVAEKWRLSWHNGIPHFVRTLILE